MTSALKLFSSVMHGNDSVILCERYEARDLTQTSLVFTLLLLSRFIAFYPLNAWKESLVLYLTNRFHDAVRLFHNRSQTTSKCWKEPKSDAF